MGKIQEITQGFLNFFLKKLGLLKTKILSEADRRKLICNACPLNIKGFCSTSVFGKVKEDFIYLGNHRKKDDVYPGCGCLLETKVLSENTNCPLNKWN